VRGLERRGFPHRSPHGDASMASEPIGLVIVAVAALGAALVVAYERSRTFRAIVTAAFDAVKAAGEVDPQWRTRVPVARQRELLRGRAALDHEVRGCLQHSARREQKNPDKSSADVSAFSLLQAFTEDAKNLVSLSPSVLLELGDRIG